MQVTNTLADSDVLLKWQFSGDKSTLKTTSPSTFSLSAGEGKLIKLSFTSGVAYSEQDLKGVLQFSSSDVKTGKALSLNRFETFNVDASSQQKESAPLSISNIGRYRIVS